MGEKNNDKELVKRAQKGEKAAFDTLVTKYHLKVVNLVTFCTLLTIHRFSTKNRLNYN